MARKITLICIAVLLLIASVFMAGAFAVPEQQSISVGSRINVELSAEESTYVFTPAANSAYTAYLFPSDETVPIVSAYLYRGNELVARGSTTMPIFNVSLNAGEEYTLKLTGEGIGTLEIMRATLGRSFDRPISINPADGGFEKLIVRAGDAHWYAFEAQQDGPATIHAEPTKLVPRQIPYLRGVVLDSSGQLVSETIAQPEDNFAIECNLVAGKRYLVRVSADYNTTGPYILSIEQNETLRAIPESIALTREVLSLEIGQTSALGATLLPADAHPTVIWKSSSNKVASVNQNGEVRAVSSGQATITANGWGGVTAECTVIVARIPLSGIGFSQSALTLRAGESVSSELKFFPDDASNKRVHYSIDGSDIIHVSPKGTVTGLSEGTARVTAIADDGSYTDVLEVTVEPEAPKRRALLIGQQMYNDGINKVRVGSINTAQGMANLLESQSIDGERYQSTVLLDTTRTETLMGIREAFRDAKDGDLSLFYITCHGYYKNGMSFLQMYDGSVIAARDLERELRKIPGTIAVIVDCCGSGGLIGRASMLKDFNRGIVSVFSGRVGSASFLSSKYKVLASASLDQESYRISFDENVTESDMATVFARSLCDGAGWSLTRHARQNSLAADSDYDRQITLNEIYHYVSRRVTWYLDLAGHLSGSTVSYVQNVQVYPQGDPFTIFGR